MEADVFSFGIVISEVIAGSEAEAVIDETRTQDFGLDLDKLSQFEDNEIVKDLIIIAGNCCALEPTERLKADQIVGRLQRIQIRHQSGQLRRLPTIDTMGSLSNILEANIIMSASSTSGKDYDETKTKLFAMADKDGDGYLSYAETKMFAKATDGYDLTHDDYDIICKMCGAECETGLAKENIDRFYSELRMGDADKDLEAMKSHQ